MDATSPLTDFESRSVCKFERGIAVGGPTGGEEEGVTLRCDLPLCKGSPENLKTLGL